MPPPVPPSVKAGPHDGRQADVLEGARRGRRPRRLVGALDDDRRRVGLADAVEQVAEALPVLGHLDGLDGRAQQARAVALQEAGAGDLHGQVEAGLAAQAGQHAVRALALQDALHRRDRERLEVDRVGDARVGHDRGRVGVEQDGADALLAQRPAGLRAGVVELGRLADDDGPGADDEDGGRPGRVALGAPRSRAGVAGIRRAATWPRKRSKTSAASSGPGEPSGWYWTVSMGRRVVAQALDRAVVEVALADVEARRRAAATRRRPPPRGSAPSPAPGPCPRRERDGWRRGGRSAAAACCAPAARATIWWPRQMPSSGRPSAMTARASATGPSSRAGSPGPGERTTPATSAARTCAGGRGVRQHADARAAPAQRAHDVRLEAEVHDRHERPAVADLVGRLPPRPATTKSWSSQRGTARAAATARVRRPSRRAP